jgi:hypothetical protein
MGVRLPPLLRILRVFVAAVVPSPVPINSFLIRGGREACFRDRRIEPLINSMPVPVSHKHFRRQLLNSWLMAALGNTELARVMNENHIQVY